MMQVSPSDKSSLRVLIAGSSSYKTTFLVHTAYLYAEKLQNRLQEGSTGSILVILVNEKKFKKGSFFFGKYSKLNVRVLSKVSIKYIEGIKDLIEYLAFLNILQGDSRPLRVFIDDIGSFGDSSDETETIKFLPRICYLLGNFQQKEYEEIIPPGSLCTFGSACSEAILKTRPKFLNVLSNFSNQIDFLQVLWDENSGGEKCEEIEVKRVVSGKGGDSQLVPTMNEFYATIIRQILAFWN